MSQVIAAVLTLLIIAAPLFSSFDCWLYLTRVCEDGESAVQCQPAKPRARKVTACGSQVIVVDVECQPISCSSKTESPCSTDSDCAEPKRYPCCVLVHRDLEGLRWEPEGGPADLPEIPRIAYHCDPVPISLRTPRVNPINIHPIIASTVLLM